MFGAMTARTTKGNMKNGTESKKQTTPKTPKAKRQSVAKPAKTAKRAKEPADRLPATIDELKAGKAGLATRPLGILW